MINHVVLFKLKQFPAEEKTVILNELKDLLLGLQDKIEELVYIEAGINHEPDSKNYDLALISHFKSLDDLERYRVHPAHMVVVKRMGEVAETRAAVDFEF
ncbi:MAG: Dabb family protein [Bacteroidota bacterium]